MVLRVMKRVMSIMLWRQLNRSEVPLFRNLQSKYLDAIALRIQTLYSVTPRVLFPEDHNFRLFYVETLDESDRP